MTIWLFVLGVAIIVIVFYDAFVTTVSPVSAGGPISHPLGLGAWRLLQRLARSPSSRLLAGAGSAIVFHMLVLWTFGLWVGWSLVFSAEPGAVVDSASGVPADGWSRVYYAGFTLYTLGLGDLVPVGAAWQVATVVATINGFVLITMAVSYLIPVVQAVTERRQYAMRLYGLGVSAEDVLLTAWDGRSFDDLVPHLLDLTPVVARSTQNHLSYPVLHYFHSPSRDSALEPGFGVLDEALLLLEHGVAEEVRPGRMVLQPLRRSLDTFAEIVGGQFTGSADGAPPAPRLEALRRAGIPTVTDEELAAAVAARGEHRRLIAGVVADSLWPGEQAVSAAD